MRGIVLAAALAALLTPAAHAQQGDGTRVAAQVHTVKPEPAAVTPQRLAALQAPDGFEVGVFADGLLNPRILAVSPEGRVYVSRREQGDVLMFEDRDGDGRADGPPVTVAHRPDAHGLAIHDGRLYIATVKEIFVAPLQPDGRAGTLEMLVGDLPDGGQHPNRTMAFGPDGYLYVSIGSTCNACNETNPEHAALLRMSPDGKSRTIFASGLRNTIGFDWHPRTGALWGMDHGIDMLGDDIQSEELNLIQRGKQYGWPHVYDRDGLHPQTTPPGGISKEEWRARSEPMRLGYTPHAAPMQMLFYRGGGFPAEYVGDAFVAMRGSWNRAEPSGYEIVRIRYRNGEPQGFESFVSGFLTDGGRTHIARPVGLAVAADGSLLMSDDGNGVIYRVAYTGQQGQARRGDPGAAPAREMERQAAVGNNVPLAMQRRETRGGRSAIEVSSPAFGEGAAIPARYSEYADGLSPPLRWSAVDGAQSYLIVMEDPDARSVTPFVHWVAWNIPPDVTELPEGLQEQPRLTEPEGVMQGATSRGSSGYFGPRPPVGDPPHRYHFQVFALDTMLEVPINATRDEVLKAASGHVIGRGELVGIYAQAVEPPR